MDGFVGRSACGCLLWGFEGVRGSVVKKSIDTRPMEDGKEID